MDYGIIFIIIIVVIIIIAIILIIYANRNNTQNLLLTLPNYRIQNVATGGYLGLVNVPNFTSGQGQLGQIPIYNLADQPFIPFWFPVVTGDASVNDSLGLWKINVLKQISVDVAEVNILNDVYLTESPGLSLGYIGLTPTATNFTPITTANSATIFTMTTIAPNTFTLFIKQGLITGNFPVIIDNKNFLTYNFENPTAKPVTFRLTLV